MEAKPIDEIKNTSGSKNCQLLNTSLNIENNWKMNKIEPFNFISLLLYIPPAKLN